MLARSADAPELAGRELTDAWEAALEASGLPVFRSAGRSRGRVAFGAPLPAGMAAERELADIVLTEFVPTWQVREGLAGRLPDGWRLVDLYDVWLGEAGPRRAGRRGRLPDRGHRRGRIRVLAAAAAALLAAERLPRERQKGGVDRPLRPAPAARRCRRRRPMARRSWFARRTRFHPVLGTGRPEEVVAALGDAVGRRRSRSPRSSASG